MLWFGSGALGLVIAAAMVFNHLAAALAGILIPLALDRFGQDPAIASSVFVTTVTDVTWVLRVSGTCHYMADVSRRRPSASPASIDARCVVLNGPPDTVSR